MYIYDNTIYDAKDYNDNDVYPVSASDDIMMIFTSMTMTFMMPKMTLMMMTTIPPSLS